MSMVPILITNILPTGSAFAVRVGGEYDGETVFLPGKVSSGHKLVVATQVNAVLVPNTQNRKNAPWLAHSLDALTLSPTQPPMPAEQFMSRLVDAALNGGALDDAQVVQALGAWVEGDYASATTLLR